MSNTQKYVKITWRGWQGHFIIPSRWHLNTLLEFPNGKKYVVSTVGEAPDLLAEGKFHKMGSDNRTYETMAFESDYGKYNDANVEKQIAWDGEWSYTDEDSAQTGHYSAIEAIISKFTREGGNNE